MTTYGVIMNEVPADLASPKSRIFNVQSDFTTMLLGFRSLQQKQVFAGLLIKTDQAKTTPKFVTKSSLNCPKFISKLSLNCPDVIYKLSLICPKVASMLSLNCPKVISRLSLNCLKFISRYVVPKLSQSCL